MKSMAGSDRVRSDIQALRALAVTMVVLYHLWPDRLRGGYVGVDVFFVISGFLITAHLVREVERTGRIRVGEFWARRAKRLLPASLLVLAVTGIAVLTWSPAAYWRQFISEIVASTFYVENWFLIGASTDYLAAENAPSPTQHYWSLSAEEQFYLVWPLIIICALVLAQRLQSSRMVTIATVLGVVTAASFVVSLWFSFSRPPFAYFATPVRAWEFGAGALLAILSSCVARLPGTASAVLAWAGWLMVAASAVWITGDMPFPGWIALVPVAGALAILMAGDAGPSWSPRVLTRWPVVQRIGDWSYSIYLWHWPLIVILPYAIGGELTALEKVVLLAATVALAAATYYAVENPVRRSRIALLAHPGRVLGATAAAMGLVVALSVGGMAAASAARPLQAPSAAPASDSELCVGATAFAEKTECEAGVVGRAVRPDVADVLDDTGGAFHCYEYDKVPNPKSCTFGSEESNALTIALVGDSHAAMLIPGLRTVAEANNWRITTWVGNGCVWRAEGPRPDECAARRAAVDRALRNTRFDVILTTARREPNLDDRRAAEMESLFIDAWQTQVGRGVQVVVLADNPRVTQEALDCVLRDGTSARAAEKCEVTRLSGYAPHDVLAEAAARSGIAEVLDLGDLYCMPERCPLVAGDVMMYRDMHHITATYSREIAPILAARLDSIVRP